MSSCLRRALSRAAATGWEGAERLLAKKRADAREVAQYMDQQKAMVCQIIGNGLQELAKPEKLQGASPRDITTALGTLIDKWTMITALRQDKDAVQVELAPELQDYAK